MIIRIFFALVALAILGLAIASSIYIFEKVEKPKAVAVREIKTTAPPKPIDPGIGEFEAAIGLLERRQWMSARDKFRHIIRFFPDSERYAPARHVCGELNLDMVVSPEISEFKSSYEVKRGDAVLRIAATHDTTLEYLKRVNGLMDFKISPGDQLMVRTLDFEVKVMVSAKKLIMMEAGEFFAEFDLEEVRLPSGVRLPYDDEIKSKTAWLDRSSVRVTEKGYDEARKQLRLGRRGLIISSPSEEVAESGSTPEAGIFMDPVGIEELNMLLRVGTPIHVAL